jgi:hypothetical protein
MVRQRPKIDPVKMRLQTIRAIQAMRRKLDLDDDAYRDLVERNSARHGPAVRSAGDCNQAQLDAAAIALATHQQPFHGQIDVAGGAGAGRARRAHCRH